MAITTLDGLVAGFKAPNAIYKVSAAVEAAGVMHSTFYTPGVPGAAVTPTPGLAGAALTTYAGQIPWTNPGAGNSYLGRLVATAGGGSGQLQLLDRLWHNSGITITTTTGQTIDSVAWPARDRDGTTNGADILVGIEVSTATGNGAAITNTTLTYTNSAGTGSRTATMASFPATAVAGTFVPFELAVGDLGVRSIQTLTLGTSYVSGTIHLVAYRVLAALNLGNLFNGNFVDSINSGFPRFYNDTVLFLVLIPAATGAQNLWGQMIVAQG